MRGVEGFLSGWSRLLGGLDDSTLLPMTSQSSLMLTTERRVGERPEEEGGECVTANRKCT